MIVNDNVNVEQEDEELTAYINENIEKLQNDAKIRLMKVMRKNRREIKRLNDHATECLISNNKDGYKYAINKIRSIAGLSDNNQLDVLWETSRERVIQLIYEASNSVRGDE